MPQVSRSKKSLRALVLETAFIIALFGVIGHLCVNFWERYLIQNELAKMRVSLHSLKTTVNYIENVYDTLEKEMVVYTSTDYYKPNIQLPEPKPSTYSKATLDRRNLCDKDIQTTAKPQSTKEVYAKPMHTDRNDNVRPNTKDKNATAKISLPKHVQTINDVNVTAIKSNTDKEAEASPLVYSKALGSANVCRKNAATITTYPKKSTAVGKDESLYKYRHRHQEIDKCCSHQNRDRHTPRKVW